MKKKLYILFIFVIYGILSAKAQNFRTGVLVYGENNSALAAALQAAKSGAKTTVLLPHGKWFLTEVTQPKKINGMALCVLDTILKTDSLRQLPKNYNENIFKYLDTLKNLTIIKGIDILSAERKGNTWQIFLNSKTTMKADEIVDATIEGKIAKIAGAKLNPKSQYIRSLNQNTNIQWQTSNFLLARSNLSTGIYPNGKHLLMPFSSFLASEVDHLILAGRIPTYEKDTISHTAEFSIGQAAGAIAAYGSFFKDQTPQLFKANIRIIQTELLNYHLSIFELDDILPNNKNWQAIQQTLLCGFFAPKESNASFTFQPDLPVDITEIRPVLQNMYFKTAVWFEDHPLKDSITVKQAIELVCYLGNKGLKLSEDRIQRNWDKSYGFGNFQPDSAITRIQFTALVKDYLMSFPLKIDLSGKLRD